MAFLNATRREETLAPITWSAILAETGSAVAEGVVNDTLGEFSTETLDGWLRDADFDATSTGYATFTDTAAVDEVAMTLITRYRALVLTDGLSHLGIGRVPLNDGDYYYALIIAQVNVCDPATQEDARAVQIDQGERMLALVNAARADIGLRALTLNTDGLYDAARWYSDDMRAFGYPTERAGGVAHVGSDGSSASERIARAGYAALSARENILARWDLSAEGAFDQWWNSPGHKANILADDIQEMGLAFTCNPQTGQYFYTQVFATPVLIVSANERRDELHALVNAARTHAGLPALAVSADLVTVADEISAYFRDRGDFPADIWDRVRAVYPWDDIEVFSTSGANNSEGLMAYWLDGSLSSALLNDALTEIGIGVSFDDATTTYFYIVFVARPR